MSEKKYFKFIAYLQVIGIILVVAGHSFHEVPDGQYGHSILPFRMIYSFHVPLFIFVSGFLFYTSVTLRDKKIGMREFFSSKFKRLLIPYFVLSLITFFPRTQLSAIADEQVANNIENFIKSFLYSDMLVIPYFWYLQILFLLSIITFGIILITNKLKISSRTSVIIITTLFAGIQYTPIEFSTFWSLNRLSNMGLFFGLGMVYAAFYDKVDKYIRWNSPDLLILFITGWILLFFDTENTGWRWMCSLMGIASCISIAKLLVQHDIKILDHLVGANYMIFLLSWYLNVAAQQILHHFTDFPWWVYSLMSLTAGIYVPWLFYRLMIKYSQPSQNGEAGKLNSIVKVMAFLLGQKIPNQS